MKKINLFIVGLVAMLAFGTSVLAEDTVSLSCKDKEIAPGESTNCSITLNSTSGVTGVNVTLEVGEHLSVSNPVGNTGWTKMNSTATTFEFQSAKAVTGKSEVFSFTLTLDKSAADIQEGTCGDLCISAATITVGDTPQKLSIIKGSGTCFIPTVVEKTTDPKNPETGAFANYALIAGVAAAAFGAIIIARKSAKFYRV